MLFFKEIDVILFYDLWILFGDVMLRWGLKILVGKVLWVMNDGIVSESDL